MSHFDRLPLSECTASSRHCRSDTTGAKSDPKFTQSDGCMLKRGIQPGPLIGSHFSDRCFTRHLKYWVWDMSLNVFLFELSVHFVLPCKYLIIFISLYYYHRHYNLQMVIFRVIWAMLWRFSMNWLPPSRQNSPLLIPDSFISVFNYYYY